MKLASSFIAITSEGGLLPADFLTELLAPKTNIEGLTPVSYNLAEGERINEQVNRSWNRLKGRWADFKKAIADKQPGDTTTTETRDRWLQPLFQELGYGQRLALSKPIEVDGRGYPVSHGWSHVPIHLVGSHIDLDRRTPGAIGAAKASPHSLVQQVLNASDHHLWGIVSNGLIFRLLRDSVALTRLSYIEWDLAAIFDADLYSEFFVLWLVAHQSRFDAERAEQCWLEKWKKLAEDKGLRALENLRPGVARAIEALGAGLLSHAANKALRMKLSQGELSTQDFYRQVLRVIYRMLFLFVAEDRDLLHEPMPDADAPKEEIEAALRSRRRYRDFYAITRLRELTLRRAGTPHPDLWHIFQLITEKVGSDDGCPELALPPLGSFLWEATRSTPDLIGVLASNRHFLTAVHAIAFVQDGSIRRPIDYRNLGSEELGSVYEALLELHPLINADTGAFELNTAAGNERKTSGSYYTPDSLVQCLLDSALEPVIAQAVHGKHGETAVDALLRLKVCDPAVGSGHFLIAAAHRLAKRVAVARSGEDEPSPAATRTALRDVIGHCLYGVDINPMSAELCRVNLWLEALEPGKPLTFLDHHIRVGNSLVGATPGLIAAGIPEEAFTAIERDDKKACAILKKRNKAQRSQSGPLLAQQDAETQARLERAAAALEELPDDRLEAIRVKEAAFQRHEQTDEYRQKKRLADAWCAAFVIRKHFSQLGRESSASGITQRDLDGLADGRLLPPEVENDIERLSGQYKFFHWHLGFPEVFAKGGFDCVLGNPPWEHTELKEKEWFAERRTEIAVAGTGAERKRMIETLKSEDPALYSAFTDALREHDGMSHFLGDSGRFPFCGRGRINLYAVFAECMRALLNDVGLAGCVLPTGIATDDTTKFFFQDVVESNSLVSLYSFENEEFVFTNVHHATRFCLFTAGGIAKPVTEAPEFVFFARQVEHLRDPERRFSLSAEEIRLLNPNTRTCPIFRSGHDAELTKAIYRRVPVLIRAPQGTQAEHNPWGITFKQGLFNMTSDSHLFRTREKLEAEGWRLEGNIFRKDDAEYLPLYEAKMIHHFDHRWGTYQSQTLAQSKQGKLPELNAAQHDNPFFFSLPRYWVSATEISSVFKTRWPRGWAIAYRWVARSTDSRTHISCVCPRGGFGNSIPLVFVDDLALDCVSGLIADFASFIFDYCARQKLGGANMTFGTMQQLAVCPPKIYRQPCMWSIATQTLREWLLPLVLELTFTSWDLEPFARDRNWTGSPFHWNEQRRFLLRCELDAAFFHLYLPTAKGGEWRVAACETANDLARLKASFPTPRDAVSYILDTFPIVKRKDEAKFGDYRTKRVILEIYDAMQESIRTGQPYQTRLDPPPADPRVSHPRLKLGILAFGSLIDDPGGEIQSKIIMRIKTTTPFPVEFGRYSGRTRGGAPTLVKHDAGDPVSAEILVFDDSVSFDEAEEMLYRRERRRVGSSEKYVRRTDKDSVLVEAYTELPSVASVLYTDFWREGKVEQPNAVELATHAIESVKKADPGMDGITYLMNAMAAGIRTPLTEAYSEEILRRSKTNSLREALRKLTPR